MFYYNLKDPIYRRNDTQSQYIGAEILWTVQPSMDGAAIVDTMDGAAIVDTPPQVEQSVLQCPTCVKFHRRL